MDRRTTLKWVLAASATAANLGPRAVLADALRAGGAAAESAASARGYGTDPDLLAVYRPGELWPLTLTPAQRRLAGILADLIIPADDRSPRASAVGVVEFIDEWLSAPYPAHQRDRAIVQDGFAWLDAAAASRFGAEFSDLDSAGQHAICDEIRDESRATQERRDAAQFFARFRDLTAGGFYSAPAGRADLNYIGNVALARFEGPPLALLRALGLE
jgi:hypothetical protein